MDPRDKRDLLSDVFSEGNAGAFERSLLEQTLLAARKRRRIRKAARASAILVALVGLAWVALPHLPPRRAVPAAFHEDSRINIVYTAPLPEGVTISTKPLEASQLKVTRPSTELAQVSTQRGGFVLIGDKELLAFTAPGEAILVARDATHKELIFLHPKSEAPARVN